MSLFLQEKHNINTVSLMIKSMCIQLSIKKRTTIWTVPLSKCLSLIHINFLYYDCTNTVYIFVFILQLKSTTTK